MWSDVWPAMNEVTCLSILLEGKVPVSKNFPERCQNGLKSAQETSKTSLFGFPETLVIRSATTAARELVSSSTLTGPFEFEGKHEWRLQITYLNSVRMALKSAQETSLQ